MGRLRRGLPTGAGMERLRQGLPTGAAMGRLRQGLPTGAALDGLLNTGLAEGFFQIVLPGSRFVILPPCVLYLCLKSLLHVCPTRCFRI